MRPNHRDHKCNIENLSYIIADIQGMESFGPILAQQPYNKLDS
jgi:hypothetical protein